MPVASVVLHSVPTLHVFHSIPMRGLFHFRAYKKSNRSVELRHPTRTVRKLCGKREIECLNTSLHLCSLLNAGKSEKLFIYSIQTPMLLQRELTISRSRINHTILTNDKTHELFCKDAIFMAGLVLTFYLSVCSSCTYCSKKYRKMKPHRNKHLYYLIYIKKNSLKSMPLNISTY